MAKAKEESVSMKEVVKVLNDNSDGEEILLTVDPPGGGSNYFFVS